jgi:hypothetical protein
MAERTLVSWHYAAALLGLKAEDLMTREVVTCSREDTLQR